MVDEIEAVEMAALADLHAAATEPLRSRLGICNEYRGTMLTSIVSALPTSAIVLNRAVGLGVSEPATRELVESMVGAYRKAGVQRYFVQVHPSAQSQRLEQWLQEFGLIHTRGWAKFKRGREAPVESRTDLRVRRATAADRDEMGHILANAFDLGDVAAPWLGQLIDRPNWHV